MALFSRGRLPVLLLGGSGRRWTNCSRCRCGSFGSGGGVIVVVGGGGGGGGEAAFVGGTGGGWSAVWCLLDAWPPGGGGGGGGGGLPVGWSSLRSIGSSSV